MVEEGSSGVGGGRTMQTSEEEVREDRRGGRKWRNNDVGSWWSQEKTSGGHDCEAGCAAGWLAHVGARLCHWPAESEAWRMNG